MLATVLIGPGKPRLVQIQRPPSGTSRSSQSGASCSVTTTEDEYDSPATPLQAKNEISAFSPYDTPCQRTYGARTPMMQLANSSESVQKLRPAPLSITPRTTHHRIDSAIYVPEVERKQNHHNNDKANNNPSASKSPFPSNPFSSSTIWPTRTPTPPCAVPSSATKFDNKLRARQLSSALSLITSAIDAFPSSLLHLDAPLIRQLRNTRIPAHAYVAPLQRIFPTTSPLLLSALAAWWCVDRYLEEVLHREEDSAEMQYRDICAKSNESLHHIPRKARRMLGIRSVDADAGVLMDCAGQRKALRARAEVVRVCVGVVAQRLMEAVNGGWVVELWRAVGVCVALVEGEDSDGEGDRERETESEGEGQEWL
jgi:hypothetical protein